MGKRSLEDFEAVGGPRVLEERVEESSVPRTQKRENKKSYSEGRSLRRL